MEKMSNIEAPVITSILIQDPDDNGFTSYFAEFPEVIAEGDTEDEAKKNLIEALIVMLEIKRSEMKSTATSGNVKSFSYKLF